MRCVLLLGVLGACTPYDPAYEWPVDARRDGLGVYVADAAVDAGEPTDYQFLFQGDSPTGEGLAIILGNVDGRGFELRNATALDPIVSPDGQSLAFISPTSNSQGQLVVRALPGTDDEERTLATVSYDSTPVWSPDGRYIALEANVLVVVEVATGDVVRAIPLPLPAGGAPSPCYRPTWSADSSEVAYADGHVVLAVAIASGATRTLTAATAPERRRCGARWSPDGQSVACTSITLAPSTTSVIEVVPAVGGTPIELVRHDAFGLDPLRWSPDGRRIAYIARSASLGSELQIIDAAGGTPTVVASNGMSSLKAHAEWSRDGSMLLFAGLGIHLITLEPPTVRSIPYDVVPIEGTMSWLVTPIHR